MPELPDVEIFKQYLDATALHQTIDAVDIRFQSGVHPQAKANSLKEKSFKELFREMREKVLPTAIERRADPAQFPDDYIIPQRQKGGHCPKCDGELQQIKVSGRTTYLCPRCQKK